MRLEVKPRSETSVYVKNYPPLRVDSLDSVEQRINTEVKDDGDTLLAVCSKANPLLCLTRHHCD